MSILQPTYYTRHPDETYSVADPQPTKQPVKQDHIADAGKVIAEPVQEPVASVVAMLDKCISIIGTEMVRCKQAGDKWFMCQRFIHAIQDMQYEFKRDYPAPVSAKREWVELTDYKIVRMYAESPMCDSEMIAFARAVIAAFKEKNT